MIVLLVHVKPHTARNSSMRISAANAVPGCALEDIGVVSRDAFALPTNRSSVVCCSLWLVCSHTAGRVWGACRVHPDLHRVAALTWLDKPFGPTHPDVGCMTARRCAKVLAGGFQVSWLACCEGRPKKCTHCLVLCPVTASAAPDTIVVLRWFFGGSNALASSKWNEDHRLIVFLG